MLITDLLDKKAIKLDLQATEKEEALEELVSALAEVKPLGDKKAILKALVDRENLGSTGIGQGIAIPHGKTDKVNELLAFLGVSRKGVNFDALDGEPVYIFFLLIAPKESAGPHLKALARISRLLRDSHICQLITRAKDPEEIYRLIETEEKKH
jgi:PTS system nitrogen regulatory IIA component